MRALIVVLTLGLPFGARADDVATRLEALQTERLRPLDSASFAEALAAFEAMPELDSLIMDADVTALQAAMGDGRLDSETLTLWHLARISRLDDGLRAFVELNPAALEEARAADARRAAGQVLGPLDGIPLSIKDNIGTAGPMHTTANAEILLGNVAGADAALVANLRAAGAVILGKSSLSEFAGVIATGFPSGGNGAVAGQAVNPLGPYPTYGSSSGSAISVAAHLAVVSVGTETAGSLVAPAGVMSLVGMKPTKGLVSGEGIVPLVLNNDGAGPIARTVQDAALLLAAMDTADVDYASGLSTQALEGVPVGVLAADIAEAGQFAEVLQQTGSALAILGARMHPVSLEDPTGTMRSFIVFLSSGMRFDMMPYIAARHSEVAQPEDLIAYNAAEPDRRAPFGQDFISQVVALSEGFTPEDLSKITAATKEAATGSLEAAFAASGGAEVLVSVANLHSVFYATAGYPAITVPAGRRANGEPAGITLIGKPGEDERLLSFAFAFEQVTRSRIEADLN